MKKLMVAMFDDLDAAEHGAMTEAHATVTIGWDGRWYELDLTAANAAVAEKVITRYTRAGHRPELPPKAASNGRGRRESRTYYAGLREFAEANSIPYRKQGELHRNGVTKYTSNYYPKALLDAYSAHLASEGTTGR